MMSQAAFERIVALRKNGHTCRETAEIVGTSESSVWSAMRRGGLAGRIHEHRKGYQPAQSITQAVEDYSVVVIEAGLGGGYIATVGDVFTGNECETISAAIRSAAKVAGRPRE